MGCEGLELFILDRPQMDSIDLDSQPILGMGSDKYKILNRFRIDLGASKYFQKLSVIFLPNPIGTGEPHGPAISAYQS